MARKIHTSPTASRKRTLLKAGLSIFLFFQIPNPYLQSAAVNEVVQNSSIKSEICKTIGLKLEKHVCPMVAFTNPCR